MALVRAARGRDAGGTPGTHPNQEMKYAGIGGSSLWRGPGAGSREAGGRGGELGARSREPGAGDRRYGARVCLPPDRSCCLSSRRREWTSGTTIFCFPSLRATVPVPVGSRMASRSFSTAGGTSAPTLGSAKRSTALHRSELPREPQRSTTRWASRVSVRGSRPGPVSLQPTRPESTCPSNRSRAFFRLLANVLSVRPSPSSP